MSMIRPSRPTRFQPECLFRPSCVAVIGTQTQAGAQVLGNLRAGGFAGRLLAVGPERPDAPGVAFQPTIPLLCETPDLAVIAAPAEDVAPALAALGRRGTFAAVVTEMAPDLAAAASSAGVRVLGPGSFGIAVPGIGLNASRAHLRPDAGKVALVSQSGALCRAVLDWAGPNGVGFSHIVGIGGNADLGFGVVLDWLARDPGTGLILLDIRRIRDRREFLSAARACARLRPVVAIRAGGRLLDPTGQAEAAFEAALRRAGVICVSGLDELLAAAETLTRARPPRSEALAIVTNAIGPGQMAADAALADGLTLARLSDATREVLGLSLPGEGIPAAGPVYAGIEPPMRLADAASMLAGAPEVGGVLVIHAPTGPCDDAAIAALAAGARSLRVPLLVCAMGETTGAGHRRSLAAAGVPVFATPGQAARGFHRLVEQRRARAAARELPPSTVLPLAPDRAEVRRLFRRARASGRLGLTQDEAMAVLTAYGVPVVPARTAMTPEDAAVAASLLGFPAVVKLRRRQLPEEATGALALDLAGPEDVRRAAAALAGRRHRGAAPPPAEPDAADPGFLVQRQVGRAQELRVRVGDDPVFGPAIAFGQGGPAGPILNDLAFDLPPLNLPLAHALIARTRVARMLAGLRDRRPANEDAVAETLVRVSQLVVDFPGIAELQLDPLFADADGVLVADAWLRLRPPGESAALAIAPYPAELSETVQLGGERLTIRPIRPEDAEAHAALFRRLTPEDVRYRFFSLLRDLSPEQIARMTQVDYGREMAFVAVREEAGETVGVARLVREPGTKRGEFAVVVQPDMKGKGLATRLMRRLFDWGRREGLADIFGQVLADNAPMLAFVRHLGFAVQRLPQEPDVVEARLNLDAAEAAAPQAVA